MNHQQSQQLGRSWMLLSWIHFRRFTLQRNLCRGLYRPTFNCNQLWLCSVETEKESTVFSLCVKCSTLVQNHNKVITDNWLRTISSGRILQFRKDGWVISSKVMWDPVVTSNTLILTYCFIIKYCNKSFPSSNFRPILTSNTRAPYGKKKKWKKSKIKPFDREQHCSVTEDTVFTL